MVDMTKVAEYMLAADACIVTDDMRGCELFCSFAMFELSRKFPMTKAQWEVYQKCQKAHLAAAKAASSHINKEKGHGRKDPNFQN